MTVMKKVVFVACLLLVSMVGFSQGWRNNEMEALVTINNASELVLLNSCTSNFDVPGTLPAKIRAYIIPDELLKLKKTGLPFQISIPNLQAHYQNFWTAKVPSGYYTYEQVIAIADSLATNFPTICKKITIGTSLGNRQLAVLKLSDNANTDENEAEILFEAGIHGDEIGGTENLIRFARDLCKGYGSNTQYTNLLNTREVFLYLMVNPDGRHYMSRYNNNSVDINRDGGYMWNGEGNSTGPYSQSETKSQRDYVFDNQFVVFSDYHSGTEFVSYPWSYRPDATPDDAHIDQLAGVYASSSGYINIPYSQGYSGMYPINGSTKDVNYGSLGSVSWSIEISMEKQPPSSQIYSYYLKNKPAMLALVERCGYGVSGTITDSLTGMPVPALIFVNNYYPCYNDPVLGDYHKYVLAGTYSIKVVANGYKTKTINNIVVGNNATAITDIQLSPQTGDYGYRVCISYIPNNNFSDEGKTFAALGPPDNSYYSLGRNGYIIIDMQKNIINGNGADFKVFEGDPNPEGYSVYASSSMDGPWTLVGNGVGSQEFDLPVSISSSRYIKIKDDGDGSSTVPDAGFELDAVKILYTPVSAQFTASNTMPCILEPINFFDASAGNPITWNWIFTGGNPPVSNVQNPTGITYSSPGSYDVSLTVSDGLTTNELLLPDYIQVFGNPEKPTVPQGDSVLCQSSAPQEYFTTGQANATDFQWKLEPTNAGVLVPNWTLCSVDWDTDFQGVASLSVKQLTACGSSDYSAPITIEVSPLPIVNLGPDQLIPANETLMLDAGNSGASYLWSSGETTQTIIVDSSGYGIGTTHIWVKVTNNFGCASSDTVAITFSTNIGMKENTRLPVMAIPNPTTTKTWINLVQKTELVEYWLLNAVGDCVQNNSIKANNGGFWLNVEQLPKGLYVLKLKLGTQLTTLKILIM